LTDGRDYYKNVWSFQNPLNKGVATRGGASQPIIY
jgi:hypothetical protein